MKTSFFILSILLVFSYQEFLKEIDDNQIPMRQLDVKKVQGGSDVYATEEPEEDVKPEVPLEIAVSIEEEETPLRRLTLVPEKQETFIGNEEVPLRQLTLLPEKEDAFIGNEEVPLR